MKEDKITFRISFDVEFTKTENNLIMSKTTNPTVEDTQDNGKDRSERILQFLRDQEKTAEEELKSYPDMPYDTQAQIDKSRASSFYFRIKAIRTSAERL